MVAAPSLYCSSFPRNSTRCSSENDELLSRSCTEQQINQVLIGRKLLPSNEKPRSLSQVWHIPIDDVSPSASSPYYTSESFSSESESNAAYIPLPQHDNTRLRPASHMSCSFRKSHRYSCNNTDSWECRELSGGVSFLSERVF